MQLQELVPTFVGEDKTTECKQRLNTKDPFSWLKTFDGFANTNGGNFYFGVKDKTGELVGYTLAELDQEKNQLFPLLKKYFPVSPVLEESTLSYTENGKTRYIYCVHVEKAIHRPLILLWEEINAIFVRDDGFTRPASQEEIYRMALSGPVQFDKQPTAIPYHREDFTQLNSFYAERHAGKELSDKALASLGFFDEKGNLRKGALLFSDHYEGEETKVSCMLFPGTTRGSDEILDSLELHGNLIQEAKGILDFIHQHMNHGFKKTPDGRVDFNSYPERSLFEATINSLAHRDYLETGTQISVEIFRDRLLFTSPGSFYGIGEVKETRNLSSYASRRRNELISSVFVYCHAMEAKGTGFEKIEEDYSSADFSHKPFLFSRHNTFCLVLPDLTYADGVSLSQEAIHITNGKTYSVKQLSLLAFCYTQPHTIKEFADHLSLSNSTYFRNSILKPLEEDGLLVEKKIGNAKTYQANHNLVQLQ